MKKVLRVLGFLILAIVLLIAAGAAFIHFRGVPSYEPREVQVNIPSDSTSLARGEHLARSVGSEDGIHFQFQP